MIDNVNETMCVLLRIIVYECYQLVFSLYLTFL